MTEETDAELELEEKIVEYCKETPKGVPQKTLIEHLNVEPLNIANAINGLLKKGRIEILKGGKQKKGVVIRWKNNEGPKIKGDNEKKIIYQIIESAGNKGIWVRDIRNKCNLVLTHVTKILKLLESEKLIKSVKSVEACKRKLYMLYNLEPDTSVTGGAWYSNEDFDQDFVEILNQQCYKYLYQKLVRAKAEDKNPLMQRQVASATADDVRNHISKLGISKVELSIRDIEVILNTLVYDGKVEKVVKFGAAGQSSSESVNTYLSIESLVKSVGLMQIPCGLCPMFRKWRYFTINMHLYERMRQIEIHMKNKDIIILWKNNEGSKIKIEGDNEKKVIYQYIELAGNKGIIGQKLAKTCKLVLKNVNVILKDLEKEGLIKSVKSVAEKNRKVYMLYNLEPDIAVTGGTFYNNTEFDQEYVDILNQLFHKYLNQKLIRAKAGDKNPLVQRQFASATADEVITHISKLGISKEKLTIKDAELILNTLVYDGKVEKIGKVGAVGQTTSNSLITYLAVEGLVTSVGVLESPCGLCPVSDNQMFDKWNHFPINMHLFERMYVCFLISNSLLANSKRLLLTF
uniref:DNA-directed RNA polymerase III subunit RPC6 n=1 Tax=Strigamia maritima TaxID=126957 RepID=T1J5Z6_STRMM